MKLTEQCLKDFATACQNAENEDTLRGMEAQAAKAYFDVFPQMILSDSPEFQFQGRNRRPPKDRCNALLSFYRFLTARLGLRKIDTFYRDAGAHSQTQKDLESGEKKAGRAYNQSLDARAEDDENNSRTLLDQQAHVDEHPSDFDATFVSYLALMLSLPERLKGKACNDARINYFRMFYTDFTTGFLRGEKNYLPCIKHERDVFYAMKLPFLDFFMEKKMLAKLLRMAGDKPVLQAVSSREKTGQMLTLPDGRKEPEYAFVHQYWQQILHIEVETTRL